MRGRFRRPERWSLTIQAKLRFEFLQQLGADALHIDQIIQTLERTMLVPMIDDAFRLDRPDSIDARQPFGIRLIHVDGIRPSKTAEQKADQSAEKPTLQSREIRHTIFLFSVDKGAVDAKSEKLPVKKGFYALEPAVEIHGNGYKPDK